MPTGVNLFAAHDYYVNDVYRQRVHELMGASWVDQNSHRTLERMSGFGSAFWIDRVGKIRGEGVTLEHVFSDAAAQSTPPLIVAILYDLPNRDCHAMSSNGELCCQYASDGTCIYNAEDAGCSEGLARYKHEYVDAFAEVLERYSQVPAAVIIKPDSMANLATNTDDENCGNGATQAAYVQGIRYAIETLHRRAPRAALYLDAAHGGWLGWPDKADAYLAAVGRLGDAVSFLRGFATNVANYQSLGAPCPSSAFYDSHPQLGQQYCASHQPASCCEDPCGLFDQYNSGNNEHNWIQLLAARLARSPVHSRMSSPKFVIDTGRNGRVGMRQRCSNWCNVRGAGLGHAPTSHTLLPDLIDAYFWLKTPGESDGCTETLPDGSRCARYDGTCGSEDSFGSSPGEPRAPEAGEWFVPHAAELICRAQVDSTSGERGDGRDEERCTGTVSEAVRVSEELQATVSSPPPPPRYEYRNPAPGHFATWSYPSPRSMPIGGPPSPVAIELQPGCSQDGSSGVATLLFLCLAAFITWFLYPRFEPRLRQRIGTQRYEAYVTDLGQASDFLHRKAIVAASLVAAGAAQAVAAVKRWRMIGVDATPEIRATELPRDDTDL